ncbi:MAG: hypothetical protein R3Y22_10070 [Bacteroidales bacterium]
MRKYLLFVLLILPLVLTGCFSETETTKRISSREVRRHVKGTKSDEEKFMELYELKDFSKWEIGRLFYVTDNKLKSILTPYDGIDTLNLADKVVKYQGYSEYISIDGEKDIALYFLVDDSIYIEYQTNRTMEQITEMERVFKVPFMVDMELIVSVNNLLKGRELYIKTPLWYDENNNLIKGERFIPVVITEILPGDATLPLKLKFQSVESGVTAYLFISSNDDSIINRSFESIFSFDNPKNEYPNISDENWKLIIKGRVAVGMTKDECRLSLGSPNSISSRPNYSTLVEIWYYNNGAYLIFEDGLLTKFRR